MVLYFFLSRGFLVEKNPFKLSIFGVLFSLELVSFGE